MKRTLFLFNPENDLALANGSPYFCAPESARVMKSDLSLLPLWYAEGKGTVWTDTLPEESEWLEMIASLNLNADWAESDSLPAHLLSDADLLLFPWGWSPACVDFFRKRGIAEQLLPDAAQIDLVRQLSHRSTTLSVLRELQQNSSLPFASFASGVKQTTLDQIHDFAAQHKSCVYKAPWSGSGKGIHWCAPHHKMERLDHWAEGILAKQGSVIAEQKYNKILDFAMEFHCQEQQATFSGYSLFYTDMYGTYEGNLLASDSDIEKQLSNYVSPEILQRLRQSLVEILTTLIAPHYQGYMGIDMFVYQTEEKHYAIHPCVEINLRMNMGMVARLIYDLHVEEGKQGIYSVDYQKEAAELYADHRQRMETQKGEIRNGKLSSGYFSLTPVTRKSHYRVRVEIKEMDIL